MIDLKKIKLFLLDMDGTLYLGDQLLPNSMKFIDRARLHNKKFSFLTNNSSKGSDEYINKLDKMGIKITKQEIITSGMSTINYLKNYTNYKKVYLVSTAALEREFIEALFEMDDEEPDCVVIGFDTTLTYAKLWKLCNLVSKGKPYIATHPDFLCPTESGYMPDIGAMIAFVKAATGRDPDVIAGKPNRYIVEAVNTMYGFEKDEIAIVGDRLYTDIAMGAMNGITSILVLTGETKLEHVKESSIKPDFIFEDLGELSEHFT